MPKSSLTRGGQHYQRHFPDIDTFSINIYIYSIWISSLWNSCQNLKLRQYSVISFPFLQNINCKYDDDVVVTISHETHCHSRNCREDWPHASKNICGHYVGNTNKFKKKTKQEGDLRLVVIPRPQQPIVKINVQFVLNGSPPHLADNLSCCNLAIELSRNLVTKDYLAAYIVCLSVCAGRGRGSKN